ncbi:DUF58 domain-containing protein [Tautonia sociabilis]|uniref:DUF58 domain-containing protein n=1 Tax=Tautonia sociabilis TaxID=2080755 RepID=A0A432MJK8_9BACT|nr:DUF58 domain-containing protein [Tautonia sociabilis]RUL87318.1 DUF58 domain-containing protein [Tautonia sociabilis]
MPFGFFSRQRPEPSAPEVDPAAIVRRARRLRFRVRPTAVAQLAGAYHGARPGTGLTFAELRAYEPGDDVRHLDWNVTARQGRPFVRRYVEERSLSLRLIVDVSASLRFGPDGRTKADRAAQAAALLAAAAIQNGDRAGLTLVSDRVEAELPPGGGPRHLARLLRMLVASPTSSRKTALTAAVARPRRFARRGLVVVLGDFLSPEPVGPWRRLARRGEVVAVRVSDPREERLPEAGILALEDAETGRRRVIDTGSKRLRAAYARAAEARRRSFRSWCDATGVAGLELSTDDDPLGPLLRYFRGRAGRRTASR